MIDDVPKLRVRVTKNCKPDLGMDPPFVQDEDIADLTAALSLISRLRSEKDEYRCAPRHHSFVREI